MSESFQIEIPKNEVARFEVLLELCLEELRAVNQACRELQKETRDTLDRVAHLQLQMRTRLGEEK